LLILGLFCLLYSLYFQCYRPDRDLHSFPTRRSSDLSWEETTVVVTADHETGNLWGAGTSESNEFEPITGAAGDLPNSFDSLVPRSEEHTSELQSRFDLVCRLLLEKQKTHR